MFMSTTEKIYEAFKNFPSVSTDTRTDVTDTIFFALSGENFNGNEFASEAIRKGAKLAVIDDEMYCKGENYILVDNVLETLQELALLHREKYEIPVLAITGSNGKTTTKELISAVVNSARKVISTQGNLNNHIGVPLTILRINPATEIAVVEMGANHQGEIKRLCTIARPDVGIITNIGKAHLEGFGGFEGVIKAKSELYQWLESSSGNAIVHADDPLLMKLSTHIDKLTYGTKNGDIFGEIIAHKPFLKIIWKFENAEFELNTKLYGKYNFPNILAAIASGIYFGIEPDKINHAISEYSPENNRSQQLKTSTNSIVLDAYNANPVSMAEAILSFHESGFDNPWLILGDMFELGEVSLAEHQKITDLLSESGFTNILLVGNDFSKTDVPEKLIKLNTTKDAAAYLEKNPITNASILIKGSRGMKLETLLTFL